MIMVKEKVLFCQRLNRQMKNWESCEGLSWWLMLSATSRPTSRRPYSTRVATLWFVRMLRMHEGLLSEGLTDTRYLTSFKIIEIHCVHLKILLMSRLFSSSSGLFFLVPLCPDGGPGWYFVPEVWSDIWRSKWPESQGQTLGWKGSG